MRISDWSSDVCSSDLLVAVLVTYVAGLGVLAATSSAMAGNMVMGEAGEMGDCQGCDPVGGDDPVSACDTPCLTPLMATLTSDAALRVPLSEQAFDAAGSGFRSEERRVGKECVRTCRSRWA